METKARRICVRWIEGLFLYQRWFYRISDATKFRKRLEKDGIAGYKIQVTYYR